MRACHVTQRGARRHTQTPVNYYSSEPPRLGPSCSEGPASAPWTPFLFIYHFSSCVWDPTTAESLPQLRTLQATRSVHSFHSPGSKVGSTLKSGAVAFCPFRVGSDACS